MQISNNSFCFNYPWHYMAWDTQDSHFNEQIANKVGDNLGQKITQKEMQEAQKFLNKQMDNLMLKLYEANPESDILKAYNTAKINMDTANDEYEKFLYKAKEYLSDTEKLKEIDKDTLWTINYGMICYNFHEMTTTGYEFFSALSDMLSPMEQEQIINAIAKVMGFYSQANSIEINGIKISWEPQTNYIYSSYSISIWSIYGNVGLMNFEVSYPQSNLFTNVADNLLVSLTSNFNPTQSVFEILEQKDKQEQANQTLKNTQTNQSLENQTLENQTLESRQAKKAYDDYKSNPLTSKASKEINDFVNEVIKKAKV